LFAYFDQSVGGIKVVKSREGEGKPVARKYGKRRLAIGGDRKE